jgi:hypothetical protein
MILTTAGELRLKKFENTATGLFYNSAGYVDKIDLTTTSQFLRGDGTFSTEIIHNDQGGGMQLHQLGTTIKTNEIKFLHNNVQQWAIGSHLSINSSDPASFFIWNNRITAPRVSLYIDGPTNNVGLGTEIPETDLDVKKLGEEVKVRAFAGGQTGSNYYKSSLWAANDAFGYGLGVDNNGVGHFYFNYNTPSSAFTVTHQGRIGINMIAPNYSSDDNDIYKLYVDGGIKARDVMVTATTPMPDYVFEKNYHLMSIYELESYIIKYKHLPDVISADEASIAQGVSVAEMQHSLLRKIEEQTLYIIGLQKQIDELRNSLK